MLRRHAPTTDGYATIACTKLRVMPLVRVCMHELDVPRLGTYELLRREIVTFAKNKRAFAVDDSGDTDYAK